MSDQRTALVLGGGGITGIAWEIGMLAGLAEAGGRPVGADLVVGTSADLVVGAQVTSGAELEALFAGQLQPPTGEEGARMTRSNLAQYGWALLRGPGETSSPSPCAGARPRRREGRPRCRPSRSGSTSSVPAW